MLKRARFYLNSYLKFCWLVINKQLLQGGWFSRMRIVYKAISLAVTAVLAWWGLRELVNKLPPIGKRWWAIVVLTLATLLMLTFVGMIKRFHEKVVARIYEDNEGIRKEYFDSAAKIELWTLFKGRYDALHSLLDNRRWDNIEEPLTQEEIQYHEGDFRNNLQDKLGSDWAQDYFTRLGDIPTSVLAQADRMQAHSSQLHRLIQAEQGQQRSIAAKSNWQKEEILMSTKR